LLQLVESELSVEHSGFSNPLYNQDEVATAVAVLGTNDLQPAVRTSFKPASDESGNDRLQLVEPEADD